MEFGVLKTASGTKFYNIKKEVLSVSDDDLDGYLSSSLKCGKKQLEKRIKDVKSEPKTMLKQKLSLPTNTVPTSGRKSKSKSTSSKRKDEISRSRSYDHYSQIHKRMMLMNMQTKMLQVFGQVPPTVASGSEVDMHSHYWVPSSAINLQEDPRQNHSDIDFRLDSQWNKRMFDMQRVIAQAPTVSREISPTVSEQKCSDRGQEFISIPSGSNESYLDDEGINLTYNQGEQKSQGYGEIDPRQQIENPEYKDIIPSISDLLVNKDVEFSQQESGLHNDADLTLEEISSNYASSISRTVPFVRTPSLISRVSSQIAPSYRSAWGEESLDQYCPSEKSYRSCLDIDADDEWSDNESLHKYSYRHRHTKTMPKTSPADSSDDQIEESRNLKCQIIDRIERCVDYVSPQKSQYLSDKEEKIPQDNESQSSHQLATSIDTVTYNKNSDKLQLFDSIMSQIKVKEHMKHLQDTLPRKTLSEVNPQEVHTEERQYRFPWFHENPVASLQNKAVQREISHGRLKNTGGHNSGIIMEGNKDLNDSVNSDKGRKQIKTKKSPLKKMKKLTEGKSPRKSSIASKENESVVSKEDTPKKHYKRKRAKVSGKKKEDSKMSLFYISSPSSHGSISISDHISDGSSEHAMPMVDYEKPRKKPPRICKKSPSEGFDKTQKKKGKRKGEVERAPDHTQSVPSNLLISIPSRTYTDISSVSVSKRPSIHLWSTKKETKSVPKVEQPKKSKTTRIPPRTHIHVAKPIYKTDHEVKKESSSTPTNEKKKMDMIETLHRLPTTGSLQKHEELQIKRRTKQVQPFAVKKYNITDDADFLNRKKMIRRALHSDSSDLPSGRSSSEASPRPMQTYAKNKLPFNKLQGGKYPQLFKTAPSLSPLLIQTSLQANSDGPKKFESFAKNVELSKRPAMIQGKSLHKGMHTELQYQLQSQFHFSSSSDERERLDDIREVEGLSQRYVQRLINPTPADSSSSSDDTKKIINPPGGQPKRYFQEAKKTMETPKEKDNKSDSANAKPKESPLEYSGSTEALLKQWKQKCLENEKKFEKILGMGGSKPLGATASGPEISSEPGTAGTVFQVLPSDGNSLSKDESKPLNNVDILDYKKDESLYEHQVKEFPTEKAENEREIIKEAVTQLWKIAKTKSNGKRPSWNSKIKSKVHAAVKKGKKDSSSPDKNDSSELSLLTPGNTPKGSNVEVGKTSRKNSLVKDNQPKISGIKLNESDGEAAIQKVALSNRSEPIMGEETLGTKNEKGDGKLSNKENTQESSQSNSILSNASVSDKGVKGKKARPVSPLVKKLRPLSAKSSGSSSASKGTTILPRSKVASSMSEPTSKKEGLSKSPGSPERPGSPKKKPSAPQRGSSATKKDITSTSPKGRKTSQNSKPNSARLNSARKGKKD